LESIVDVEPKPYKASRRKNALPKGFVLQHLFAIRAAEPKILEKDVAPVTYIVLDD
jgi:hypothetical protein